LKILYLTNGFPPHRWAGTETYTAGIARGIQQKGHAVQVICNGKWDEGPDYWNGFRDDVYNEILIRRLDLNWYKAPDPNKYLYNNPIIGRYVDNFIKENQPDLVHITSCETLSANIIEVVKRNNLPLVLSLTDFWFLCPRINLLHGNDSNCDGLTTPWDCLQCLLINQRIFHFANRMLSGLAVKSVFLKISKLPLITRHRGFRGFTLNIEERKFYLRRMFALADVRLTASQFVKNIHLLNGFDDELFVHPYGHDLAWLKMYGGKKQSSKIRIGFIGQIIYSKGVHLLLEAASQFSRKYSNDVIFYIYGNLQKDPDYGSRLQVIANGINNVQFRGTYAHAESAKVFSEIDILVVPSLWYDFPLVIQEAYATKTPVIATNLGGMAEAVKHNVNGLLFERNDADDLVKQIERIIIEPDLLDTLTRGIPPVKTIEQEVIELEQLYYDLVQHKRSEEF
jgi:glycosyltransferase involved in cell wall biosynthesis